MGRAAKLQSFIESAMTDFTEQLHCDKTKQMRTMGFDERQMAIVDYILEYGRVTNANVQEMFKVSRVTALRLLSGLSPLVELVGGKGVDSHYVMKRY